MGQWQYKSETEREKALRHIEEAKAFTAEMGGTDVDVKKYFFSLPWSELDSLFRDYGRRYGSSPEEYAREAFDFWKSGRRQMSGLVAKRLFEFLPPKMPLAKKYELADNVWRNFAPKTSHNYKIGKDTDIEDLSGTISNKLDSLITDFSIPSNIKNRFHWLASGDIHIEEQLLNYCRQQMKSLAFEKINLEIPVLQRQEKISSVFTGLLKTTIIINKNEISITIDKNLSTEIIEITESSRLPSPPMNQASSGQPSYRQMSQSNGGGCLSMLTICFLMILLPGLLAVCSWLHEKSPKIWCRPTSLTSSACQPVQKESNMNKAMLIGRLGKGPELLHRATVSSMANMRIATEIKVSCSS
jgi:hypothetical protein